MSPSSVQKINPLSRTDCSCTPFHLLQLCCALSYPTHYPRYCVSSPASGDESQLQNQDRPYSSSRQRHFDLRLILRLVGLYHHIPWQPLHQQLPKGMVQAWVGQKLLTAQPLWLHICNHFFNESIFVPWQRLIAQNVLELFLFNCGVSHFYAACRINDVSKGFVLGSKIDATFGFGLP